MPAQKLHPLLRHRAWPHDHLVGLFLLNRNGWQAPPVSHKGSARLQGFSGFLIRVRVRRSLSSVSCLYELLHGDKAEPQDRGL